MTLGTDMEAGRDLYRVCVYGANGKYRQEGASLGVPAELLDEGWVTSIAAATLGALRAATEGSPKVVVVDALDQSVLEVIAGTVEHPPQFARLQKRSPDLFAAWLRREVGRDRTERLLERAGAAPGLLQNLELVEEDFRDMEAELGGGTAVGIRTVLGSSRAPNAVVVGRVLDACAYAAGPHGVDENWAVIVAPWEAIRDGEAQRTWVLRQDLGGRERVVTAFGNSPQGRESAKRVAEMVPAGAVVEVNNPHQQGARWFDVARRGLCARREGVSR